MTTDTKQRTVLRRAADTSHSVTVFDNGEDPWPSLELPFAKWEHLGRPDVITVTVEPGDLLNR